MERYRNIGAPFRCSDGTMWGRDEEREADPHGEDITRRIHKMKRVTVDPNATPQMEKKKLDLSKGWPLSMTPEKYLELHPSGEYAELARKLLKEKTDADER